MINKQHAKHIQRYNLPDIVEGIWEAVCQECWVDLMPDCTGWLSDRESEAGIV